ncbi:MAG TPA: uroporphyrinogen decarboxylase family protein [Anaerovoracaceae bacterium]|nr:uroporphyrinogen decarboxylase family protein [Anaerovoracaceae bacterium]
MKDYICDDSIFTGISKEFAESNSFKLPDLYENAEDLFRVSALIQRQENKPFCVLPFDPWLTAEAKGADIKIDDSNLGPRKNKDTIFELEDLLKLPEMPLNKGRLAETLKAITMLKEKGYPAAVEITGPFSIINGFMDIQRFLMSFRKNEELIKEIMYKLNHDILDYFIEAKRAGSDVIFYTDSSVSTSLVGPKFMNKILKWSTIPLLEELDKKLPEDTLVYLCPKLTFALTENDYIKWQKLPLEADAPYNEALIDSVGKFRFSGNTCRKKLNRMAKNSLPYFELKDITEVD